MWSKIIIILFETPRERMWRKAPVWYVDEGVRVTFHRRYPVRRTQIIEVRDD